MMAEKSLGPVGAAGHETLTIRDVQLRAVVVPMERPLLTKILEIRECALLLIDLRTEEGVIGRAYLFTFFRHGAGYIANHLRDLVAAFKGAVLRPEELHERAQKSLSLFGHSGIARMAVSGFDMACWDAHAQAQGKPLVAVLGGEPGSIRAYNSNGLGLMGPAEAALEAVDLVAAGNFEAIKIRFGRDRLADDLEVLKAVRQAVGDEIILPCDFNQGLALEEAFYRCAALDDAGLYWIEEPIAYDDFAGYGEIVQAARTPIQLGENFYGPHDMENALRAGACDFVMPDLERIGGVTGWLRAAKVAEAHNVPMSSHLYPEFSCHLMALTPTAHWLEYVNWADPILATPLAVSDGQVRVPERPGAGIAWNEKAISDFAVEF